jgi:hypothetical protein
MKQLDENCCGVMVKVEAARPFQIIFVNIHLTSHVESPSYAMQMLSVNNATIGRRDKGYCTLSILLILDDVI